METKSTETFMNISLKLDSALLHFHQDELRDLQVFVKNLMRVALSQVLKFIAISAAFVRRSFEVDTINKSQK